MQQIKLYRREIRPIAHNCYCAMGIHPTDTILDENWYPESEETMLRDKYVFTDPYDSLEFQERYVECGDRYILLKAEDYPKERNDQ